MKTVIITGGNRGLGYECARNIARDKDWYVIIACRDPREAQDSVQTLRAQSGNQNIQARELDLASLKSVNKFVDEIQKSDLPPLSALVCNAGLQVVSGTKRTQDGFEMTFGVNHLGHFLLVNRLIKKMTPPARIVIVSSGTHDPAMQTGMGDPQYSNTRLLAFPNEDVASDPQQTGRTRYTTSKLANIFFTYELVRRLEAWGIQDITVNAFDPGMMPGTGLARDYNIFMRLGWKYLLPILTLFRPGVRRVEDSGAALAWLVLAPELARVTGKYFSGKEMIPSSTESHDQAKAKELWETSTELVELAEKKL
jgi:NAD(P)-dependent dehydrogenase (short-subunit alcohol dehydrogenase family)